METLPSPSPSPDAGVSPPPFELPRHVPRPGELTTGWYIVTGIGWIGIVAVLAAAWSASRQLGLSTWWLGPVHDQRPPYIMLLPFVAPAVMLIVVANRVRFVPWIGVAAAVATAAVGLGDLGRVRGIGVVELCAAAAGLLVSIASFSGMYRAAGGSVAEPIAEPAAIPRPGDPADESVGAELPSG